MGKTPSNPRASQTLPAISSPHLSLEADLAGKGRGWGLEETKEMGEGHPLRWVDWN